MDYKHFGLFDLRVLSRYKARTTLVSNNLAGSRSLYNRVVSTARINALGGRRARQYLLRYRDES